MALDGDADLGAEGYSLSITPPVVSLNAHGPAGLFYAVQTLRQLFPPEIEAGQAGPGPWTLPVAQIRDLPRFAWRGMMLDVARHYFPVVVVQGLIDQIAAYKINTLHLHLTDDQGWRLRIHSWPDLALKGGSTAAGGDPGGYYTQEEYTEIVRYAASRFVTIVPEIDLPGHTNAALAAYPELNPDGIVRPLYTGIEVGFSSLAIDKDITYRFIEDVLRELSGLTPGAYLHLGGDETGATDPQDYRSFIQRVQEIVSGLGKKTVGWEEIAQAGLAEGAVAQVWRGEHAGEVVRQARKLLLSPAYIAYLDMKYTEECPLGLSWAGKIEVQDAYEWDPVGVFENVQEGDIAGIEAALWSETLRTRQDIEYMAFPRLPGLAEIAWSPAGGRSWEEYRSRLAWHAPRWRHLGINFYRSPQVDWK
jgi:hexosaminidase